MGKLISFVLAFLVTGSLSFAQPIRAEIAQPPETAQSAKTNSGVVPDGYAISGQFERILVLRFKFDTDLLAGLQRMAKEQKIRNAVILAGIGSVRNYHFHTVANRTFPPENIFVKDTTSPADIASMNGYVIDGRVHAHLTLSYADRAFGGHLEPGTTVFTFAIVTVGVFKDEVDLSRVDDWNYR